MKTCDDSLENQMIYFGMRQLDASMDDKDVIVFMLTFQKEILLKYPEELVPLDIISLFPTLTLTSILTF